MDLAKIQTALLDLNESGGANADASVTIKPREVHCYFRPTGWGMDEPSILGYGADPLEAIAEAAQKWEEMSVRVRKDQTKKLALAIIRITHEHGCCTDAALRAEFGPKEIEKYGTAALTLANEMAENGPFEIVELEGANAA